MGIIYLWELKVISDAVGCSGERLWVNLLDKALHTFTQVRLLLMATWADTLERRYACVSKEGVSLQNVDRIDALLRILKRSEDDEKGRTAFFIDSANVPLMWCSSPDRLARMLKKLAGRGAAVARIHEEGLSNDVWQLLSVVADVTLCLRVSSDRTAICKSTFYTKNGKRITKVESFKVDDQCRVSCSPYMEEKAVILPEKAKADSLEEMVLPFDIGLQLSESELEAKRNVKLPYMAAQTQEGITYKFVVLLLILHELHKSISFEQRKCISESCELLIG
uniref:Elongator complex protein 5 n=1 Tax=Parascaris univalens TaxID=6257 RepID=A0A915A5N2_PARUN